ncbi:MAG: hypothetical protein ACD_9C00252G0002 [uncultured bacterium]|nr:MAG: hypothetical protein ACD_9C00252G0002 [uncultured bacterium]
MPTIFMLIIILVIFVILPVSLIVSVAYLCYKMINNIWIRYFLMLLAALALIVWLISLGYYMMSGNIEKF